MTKEKLFEAEEITHWVLDDIISSSEVERLTSFTKEKVLKKSDIYYNDQTLALAQQNKRERIDVELISNSSNLYALDFWYLSFEFNKLAKDYGERRQNS